MKVILDIVYALDQKAKSGIPMEEFNDIKYSVSFVDSDSDPINSICENIKEIKNNYQGDELSGYIEKGSNVFLCKINNEIVLESNADEYIIDPRAILDGLIRRMESEIEKVRIEADGIIWEMSGLRKSDEYISVKKHTISRKKDTESIEFKSTDKENTLIFFNIGIVFF